MYLLQRLDRGRVALGLRLLDRAQLRLDGGLLRVQRPYARLEFFLARKVIRLLLDDLGPDLCKKINRSRTHTPTKNNTPDIDTHTRTRQEQHPKPPTEHLPQTLNNARRWRGDGACHLPRPGG